MSEKFALAPKAGESASMFGVLPNKNVALLLQNDCCAKKLSVTVSGFCQGANLSLA